MIRVAIYDDHPMTVFGLQKTFERTHDIMVSAADTSDMEVVDFSATDVAILSIDGEDPLPSVARFVSETKVLVMSASASKPVIEACLGLGAVKHLDKRLPLMRFCEAVRLAVTGDEMLRPRQAAGQYRITLNSLSPREREVLTYIADGYTHEQTARRIGISRHTVDTYIKRVRSKLTVGNKAELTRLALGGVVAGNMHQPSL